MDKLNELKEKKYFSKIIIGFVVLALIGGSVLIAYTVLKKPSGQENIAEEIDESKVAEPQPEPESETDDEPDPPPESGPELYEPEPEEPRVQNAPEGNWTLLLVNSTHPLPEGYVPQVEIVSGYKVDERIAEITEQMISDAAEDGAELLICSAYRSVDYQKVLFANETQKYIEQGKTGEEAVAVAATIVAVPGTSEHHTGLALDIVTPLYQSLDSGFEHTREFAWLNENAHKYGFILRFPNDKQHITKITYEPWHYRYVGISAAAAIKEQGLCLEEYLEQTD